MAKCESKMTAIARAQLEVLRLCADGVHVIEQATATPYAFAIGESDGARAVGLIELSSGLRRFLVEDELKFVLAQQCARIAYNHTSARAVWEKVQRYFRDNQEGDLPESFDLATNFVSMRDELPSHVARQHDQEADYIGVQLMAAHSGIGIRAAFAIAATTLSKLAKETPSSAWDVGSGRTAHSLGERLNDLRLTCGVG